MLSCRQSVSVLLSDKPKVRF